MQQFAETAATRRRLHDGFERSQPCGELWLLRPEHGLQHLGDVIEVEIGVFKARGRAERKILDEQEISLVAVTGRLRGLVHVMQEKMAQHAFVGQRRGLEKLAQLVDLDQRVHLLEPGFGLLDEKELVRFTLSCHCRLLSSVGTYFPANHHSSSSKTIQILP